MSQAGDRGHEAVQQVCGADPVAFGHEGVDGTQGEGPQAVPPLTAHQHCHVHR